LVYSNVTDDEILFVAVGVDVSCSFFLLHSLLLLNDERKRKNKQLFCSVDMATILSLINAHDRFFCESENKKTQ